MSNPHEREFHDEELSALYQATRDLEPPAWLDQHILKAAELTARPPTTPTALQPHFKRRHRSWRLPAALAATVVLAVTVVQLARETGEWRPGAESEEIRVLAEPVVETNIADHAANAANAANAAKSRAVDPAPASAASLRPVMPMGEAVHVVPQARQPAPLPPSAPLSAPPASFSEGVSRSLPFQAAPAPAPAEVERQEEIPQAAPAVAESREKSIESPSKLPAYRSPEDWLAAIAELRRQGQAAEAEASLAAFRQRYPDYRLEAAPATPR